MEWWISPSGKIISAPSSQAVSYEANGYKGPYASRAAAQAAGGGGAPAPGPAATSGWFVVPTATAPSGGFKTDDGLTVQHLSGAAYTQTLTFVSDGLAWGPYATKARALAELAGIRAGTVPNPNGSATGTPGTSTNPLSGVDAIGNFFSKLGDRDLWVRIAKVLIGGIMIIAGLARIGAPAAEKIAASLPKVVPA